MSMAMMLKSSETAMIRKAKAGDGRAMEGLIRAHQDALYAFMLRMSGRPDVAEDIVQEAYVRAYQNLRQFEGRARFSTWLTKIAIHEATARRRKQRRLLLVDPADAEAEVMENRSNCRSGDEEVSQQELKHVLAAAVDADRRH